MATQSALTRTVEGRELPPPGRWKIDPSHSEVQLVVRHMMVAKVRGRFREFAGTIRVAEVPEESSVETTIKAASIDTGDPNRDAHLRGPDFLDVERYPEITYRSTSVRHNDGDRWDVTGDLTVRGVTRTITIDVEFCGLVTDPWGNLRAGILGNTEIDREDFDLTWNQALDSGGFVLGKGVKVDLDIEAVREQATDPA
jgi:polyisoprenoid-binding protein YceI